MQSFQLVEALGWTEDIRTEAAFARLVVEKLGSDAFATIGVLRSVADDSKAIESDGSSYTDAAMALETYRKVIAD